MVTLKVFFLNWQLTAVCKSRYFGYIKRMRPESMSKSQSKVEMCKISTMLECMRPSLTTSDAGNALPKYLLKMDISH